MLRWSSSSPTTTSGEELLFCSDLPVLTFLCGRGPLSLFCFEGLVLLPKMGTSSLVSRKCSLKGLSNDADKCPCIKHHRACMFKVFDVML